MLIIMLTGLSGAGKSTLALALCERLKQNHYPVALIDGDQYRHTLNSDLGFSEADRRENIRRLMQVAEEKKKAGCISVIAAINPFEDQRSQLAASPGTLLIYVKCAMQVLLERDTKGLYKRAMLPDAHPDKLYNLSGVNDRYDIPVNPHLVIDTSYESVEAAAAILYRFVSAKLNAAYSS